MRCTGHCCRSFRLSNSIVNLRASSDRDDRLVAAMVSIIGIVPMGDTLPTGEISVGGAYFNCRMLDTNGDCMIYDARPRMCRDYPHDGICTRTGCTSEEGRDAHVR